MSYAILPDVWARLAQLDACCDVRIYSSASNADAEPGRLWIANIHRRDNTALFIEVTGESMLEAVTLAVLAAEREGISFCQRGFVG